MMLARCPSCAQNYNVPGEALGRRAKCRKCQYTFVVVIPEPEPAPEPTKVEEPPPRPHLQPKRPAPLTEWWHSRTPTQRIAAWCLLAMLLITGVYAAIEGPDDKPQRNAPPAQSFPVATQPKPWPPELVVELDKAREVVKAIVDADRKIRRELPRVRDLEVAKATAQFGAEHIVTQLTKAEIDTRMRATKTQWQEKSIEQMAKLAGALIALRRKYGMDDQRLGAEVGKILEGLKPLEAPWTSEKTQPARISSK